MYSDGVFSQAFNDSFGIILGICLVTSTLFTIVLLTLPSQYDVYRDKPVVVLDENGAKVESTCKDGQKMADFRQGRTTQVVVLGDIGRSPRMQYHAISLAKHGVKVYIIGYVESDLHPDIIFSPLIKVIPLVPAPSSLRPGSKLLFPVTAPLKALWQAQSLYRALGYRAEPARWMLVQNPPSIPTLAIALLICFLRNTHLVIDWHNFGYSILALRLGPRHPLVRISALYESFFSRLASEHITVTEAMARVLKRDYGVSARTLHDRPASMFRPINTQEKYEFLSRLPETAQYSQNLSPSAKSPWKLIVSSTSWTADEDFSLLLDALTIYSAQAYTKAHLPRLLVVITGKGPQKEHYLSQIRRLNQEEKLSHVIIQTAWLTPKDYPLLLAAADLGVSLHTSSSGVDLPMKVVDMFGAGLPVVGWGEFEAWPELVQEDVNGKGFNSAEQLARQMEDLFEGRRDLLAVLKKGALRESERTWDREWDRVGGALFKLTRK